MATEVRSRLEALRGVMVDEHLFACVIPSSDPHGGESVIEHWEAIRWITGLEGSVGTVVVTMTRAALWTNLRYFAAASEQLEGTDVELVKEGTVGSPTIAEWLQQELEANDYKGSTEVAVDGMCGSYAVVEALKNDLRRHGGMTLRTNLDPVSRIWIGRPALPMEPLERCSLECSGETVREKLARVRRALRQRHADGMLVTSIADIAWMLNLRGSDARGVPAFVSYLLISQDCATLFADRRILTDDMVDYLHSGDVSVDDYGNVAKALERYLEYNILMDPYEVNYTLMGRVSRPIVKVASPIGEMKVVKKVMS